MLGRRIRAAEQRVGVVMNPATAVVVLAGVVRSGTMGLPEIPDDLRANVAAVMNSLPEHTRSPSDGDGEPSASDIAGTQGY